MAAPIPPPGARALAPSAVALGEAAARRGAEAYRVAMRHSDLVRFLRRAIPIGAVAGFVLFVVWPFLNPFGLGSTVSVGNVRISGTRVTMEAPRMTGFRSDGRPYELTAVTAVQDLRRPNLIELNEMTARFGMSDTGFANMTAKQGLFDQQKEQMQLREEVVVRTDQQQQIFLKSADVDFRAGTVRSPQPVIVTMPDLHISADELLVVDSGASIAFTGRVRATFEDRGQIDGRASEGPARLAPEAGIRAAIVPPPLPVIPAAQPAEPTPAPPAATTPPAPLPIEAPLPPVRPPDLSPRSGTGQNGTPGSTPGSTPLAAPRR